MRASTRIAVNSLAQYGRTIINVILGFYCTRLILMALGENDFGVYSLIASVTAFLSFISTSLTITTQRYLSFHQDNSEIDFQKKIFFHSLILQIAIGVAVCICLEVVALFLFDGYLNIDQNSIGVAKVVFQCSILMVMLSLITSPFRALLVAHENLVYISCLDVVDGVLKVFIALIISSMEVDRLRYYAILMVGISIVNFLACFFYSVFRYPESHLPRNKNIDKSILHSMTSFAGWTVYSTGCTVGRVQGTAIVLNKMFGTIINAAFGVSLQLNSATQFVSSSLLSAVSPQIIKSEGIGNRARMLYLALFSSRLSFLLLSAVIVPLCCFTDEILTFWLVEYPNETVILCQALLVTSLCDATTIGLGIANQALGKIRNMSIVVYTIKLSTIFVLMLLLYLGVDISKAIWCYPFMEFVSAIARLPILKKSANLSIRDYTGKFIRYTFVPFIALVVMCYSISRFSFNIVMVACSIIAIVISYLFLIYVFGLQTVERDRVNSLVFSVISRKR